MKPALTERYDVHKDYLAERAVELALALNKQFTDCGDSPKDVDALLGDAGKILAFMEKGNNASAS